jgi:hypothetical protein
MSTPRILSGIDEDGMTKYRNHKEREFLARLEDRFHSLGWYSDRWSRTDRTIVTITNLDPTGSFVQQTLRIDFFDDRVLVGYDYTHQLVDDLDELRSDVKCLRSDSIQLLSDFAADWITSELTKRSS